jgi:hypothetical protein
MAILTDARDERKRAAYLFGSEATVSNQIAKELREKDWIVYEMNRTNCTESAIIKSAEEIRCSLSYLDMLILGYDEELSAIDLLKDPENFQKAGEKYEQSINLNLMVVHYLLPFLDAGNGKRICYVNTGDSSNNLCRDYGNYLSHIVGAALNMQAVILKNRLQPEGYTFRIYCLQEGNENNHQVGLKDCENAGKYAVHYFTQDRSYDPNSEVHSDEKRLVMRNEEGREVPW